LPELTVTQEEAERRISERIEAGENIRKTDIPSPVALIWSDLVKPPPGLTGFESGRLASARGQSAFVLLPQASCRVPAGAARRDIHPAGTARSGQGRAAVWRGEANP
jgi:hypothetical protein